MKKNILIYYLAFFALMISCSKTDNNADDVNNNIEQGIKLFPPDSEIADESLTLFIDSLKSAIQHRDTNFIYTHIDSNIHLSFGGSFGIEDFKDSWNISDSNSLFWSQMQRIMDLGGTLENTIYISPYVFSTWPSVDAYYHAAIIDSNINLLESAQTDAEIISKLSYDIVKIDDLRSLPEYGTPIEERENPFGGKDWYYVETLDNIYSGFVYWEHLRSPIDYRIFVGKVDNIWKIKTLIAGD